MIYSFLKLIPRAAGGLARVGGSETTSDVMIAVALFVCFSVLATLFRAKMVRALFLCVACLLCDICQARQPMTPRHCMHAVCAPITRLSLIRPRLPPPLPFVLVCSDRIRLTRFRCRTWTGVTSVEPGRSCLTRWSSTRPITTADGASQGDVGWAGERG